MSKIRRPPKPIGGSQPVTEIRLHPNNAQRIAALRAQLAQAQQQIQQQIHLSLISVIEATPGADANAEWTLSEDGTRIMRKVAEAPADPPPTAAPAAV